MKKLFFGLKLVAIALVVSVLSFGVALAADGQKLVTQSKDETFNGFYVRAGSIIKVNGTINGDVFLAGQDITIAGTVNGNVYAAAQTITIKGEVTGSVHLAAARVEIAAPVDGTGIIATSELKVSDQGSLGRGLIVGASTIDLAGKVGGPLYAGASTVNIESPVVGNATIAAEQIIVSGDGKFNADLKYYSATKDQVSKDKVAGQLTYSKPEQPKQNETASVLAAVIFGLLASLVLGLAVLYVAPKSAVAVANYIQSRPFVSFGSGLGFVVLVPIVLLLVFVTVIGIPLVVVTGLLYGVVLMIGEIFAALWLGRTVLKTSDQKIGANALALFVGLVILAALKLLPVLGAFIAIVSFLVGVGALVARSAERFSSVHRAQAKA